MIRIGAVGSAMLAVLCATPIRLSNGLTVRVSVEPERTGNVPLFTRVPGRSASMPRGLELRLAFTIDGKERVEHSWFTGTDGNGDVVLVAPDGTLRSPDAVQTVGGTTGYVAARTPGGIGWDPCGDHDGDPFGVEDQASGRHLGLLTLMCTRPGDRDELLVMFDRSKVVPGSRLKLACKGCGEAFVDLGGPSSAGDPSVKARADTSRVVFRSIPSGSQVFVAPAADLGLVLEPLEGVDTVGSALLGTKRVKPEQHLKLAGVTAKKFARGKTPLELKLPQGAYVALVAPPASGGANSKAGATALKDYIEDSVLGPTIDLDLDGRTGRISLFEVRGNPVEIVQLWQGRDASLAALDKLYPKGETYAFDDGEQVSRLLEGNVPARDVKPLLQLLRRGGKVVYRQPNDHRLVLQVDRDARAVTTVLRFRGWELVKQGLPAAFPVEYQDLDPRPEVKTAFGPMHIQSFELSDRFPPACSGGAGCSTGRNKEPMLIVWMTPDDAHGTGVRGSLSELDRGVSIDVGGRTYTPTSSGMTDGKYFYVFLLQQRARSFRLVLPAGDPVPLAFAGATPLAVSGAETTSPSPPPPPQLAAAADCNPPCRSGFVCVNGQCVSACNPPCATDERCTPQRECVKSFLPPVGCVPPCNRATSEPGNFERAQRAEAENELARPEAPRLRDRTGFFLAVGAGGGYVASTGPAAMSVGFRVGAGITDRLLVSAEMAGLMTYGTTTAAMLSHGHAAVQFFVWRGLYARAGAGFVSARRKDEDAGLGFGANATVGYEIRPFEMVAFSLEAGGLVATASNFSGLSPHGDLALSVYW